MYFETRNNNIRHRWISWRAWVRWHHSACSSWLAQSWWQADRCGCSEPSTHRSHQASTAHTCSTNTHTDTHTIMSLMCLWIKVVFCHFFTGMESLAGWHSMAIHHLHLPEWVSEQCFTSPPTQYHRLRGSTSPVLTATDHSYGSPKLSDFFFRLTPGGQTPNRFWRKMPQSTWIHARMCLLQ